MKRLLRSGLPLLIAVLLSGCAILSDLPFYANLLRANREGVRFRRTYEHLELDIAYSDRSNVTLDIYSPEKEGTYPVLLFVHGGGWESYNKELFAPVAMQLLPEDMVVVIPGYTLHPDATYRQMAREIADATAWTLENVDRYRGNPDRVFVSGHSAGAHLSGLVAFDSTWLAETGHSPEELRGWIGLSGVYDIAAHEAQRAARGLDSPIMTAVMEGKPNFPLASPISYVDGFGARGAWLIHGTVDQTVPFRESEAMAAALEEAGVRTELIEYPEAGHSDFLFGALGDPEAQVISDIGRIVYE